MKLKTQLVTLSKFMIAGILFWLIFSRVDWPELLRSLRQAQGGLLVGSIILFLMRNLFSALRWQALLLAKGKKVHIFNLVRFYLLANFWGFFFPTAIGGDVPRGLYLNGLIDNVEESVSSIVVERILGVIAILLLAYVAFIGSLNHLVANYYWPILFVSLLIFGLTAGLFSFPVTWLQNSPLFKSKIGLKMLGGLQSLQDYKQYPKALVSALLFSIIFQLMMIICIFLMGLAIGETTDFFYYLLFIPIVWVVSLLPISLNGLGTREGTFVYLFSLIGMSSESATLLSILNLLLLVLQGLLGAIVFLLDQNGKKDTTLFMHDSPIG